MSSAAAELSSLASSVEELVRRLLPLGEAFAAEGRDDLVADLHEAERNLVTALRRLNKATGSAGT